MEGHFVGFYIDNIVEMGDWTRDKTVTNVDIPG